MFQYFFSFDREKHLVTIEILIENIKNETVTLHLPAWRPGRYQLQNFAKNVLNFSATGNHAALSWFKTSVNTWQIQTTQNETIKVKYDYYSNELNAGSSLVNTDMIYLNPVNICMFEDIDSQFTVTLNLPDTVNYKVATGLPYKKQKNSIIFTPESYYTFFDSPLVISSQLSHYTFEANEIPFHFWIEGNYDLDTPRLLNDLKKIAEYQIGIFGKFPEKEYHFILIVPYGSYYHGVEHANSTIMVLGEQGFLQQNSYVDLLGLASHELFHTWNIAKIRPKELLPYDYTQPNYFNTCFVAEGYTTYFGDRVLLDSGVFTLEEYRHELETTFKRHFIESDNASQSLLESSFDLWVDGYEKGTPNKKVSVYHKGAIATLILDGMIREKWQNTRSMEDVLRQLYLEFGDLSKGYTYDDIVRICEDVYEGNLQAYFSAVIEGNLPVLNLTQKAVAFLGFYLTQDITLYISEPSNSQGNQLK